MAGITTSICTSAKAEFLQAGHCFAATVTPTASGTTGAFQLTSVSDMTGIAVGMAVSATGIPANTTVTGITNGTTLTLSQAITSDISTAMVTFEGDTFNVVLIKASPTGTYNAATTNYSQLIGNSDEVSGTGYTTGGQAMVNAGVATSGTTAFTSFVSNPSWPSATFTASGCMIINTGIRVNGNSGACIAVFDFGGTQSVTAGTFTIALPTDAAGTAVIQIA